MLLLPDEACPRLIEKEVELARQEEHCRLFRRLQRAGFRFCWIAFLLGVYAFGEVAGASADDPGNSEQSSLRLAETAIMYQMAVWNTPVGSGTSAEERRDYIGVPAYELALALISARDTPDSLTHLVRLLRYQFDADMSETRDCAILSKGEKIKPYLAKLDTEDLRAQCTREMDELYSRTSGRFSDRISKTACAGTSGLARTIEQFREAVSRGGVCE